MGPSLAVLVGRGGRGVAGHLRVDEKRLTFRPPESSGGRKPCGAKVEALSLALIRPRTHHRIRPFNFSSMDDIPGLRRNFNPTTKRPSACF